jgi:hypothetical protein
VSVNAFQQLQQARQELDRHRENAARMASFFVTYQTTGTGELVPPNPVPFEQPMFTEPAVTHGFALTRLPDRRHYRLPMASGGVLRWQRNDRGYYIGAWLYFRIECDFIDEEKVSDQTPVALPVLTHHFVFTGPSYKAMSPEVNEAMMGSSLPTLRSPLGR